MRTSVAVMVASQVVTFCAACSKSDSTNNARAQSGSSAQGAMATSGAAGVPTAKPGVPAAISEQAMPVACGLVTDEDMSAALGAVFVKSPVQPPSPYPNVSVCHYRNQRISLSVRTETLDRSGYERTKSNMAGGEDIAGLGDAAYFHVRQNMSAVIGTLLVLKGGTMVSFNYGGLKMDKDKAKADEQALAARVVPRL